MKLYQAGYYRLGRRGSGSGWNIVAPSVGMSEIAKAGFKGIAARLADLKQMVQAPPEAMGIFQHDRFVYLMHVNYAASGEDSRGVAYVHGYCFHLAEYYELTIHPEILFGILQEEFAMEYQPELSAYPVRESLQYRNMNERRLLDQYHLSKEQYKLLILGAICALEGYSSPMCIKRNGLKEQDTQTYRDMMYLIMKGLPYYLRQKLLSFSWHGAQTAICFSDQVQGQNYADLDTGTFQCDYSRLDSYQFTKLYNMDLFYNSRDTREQIFQNIAAFIEEAYSDPLKDAGCALIEAGFQKKIKKNDTGIEPEAVVYLLQEFFKYELHDCRETAEYIAALLEAGNQGNIQIEDKKLVADIRNTYEHCHDGVLLEPMALFEARSILGYRYGSRKKEDGFAALLEMKNAHANDLYPAVCRYLESLDADYFSDYFWNQFLPGELTSLNKAERFFQKNGQAFLAKEHRLFQKLLKDLAEREMKEADSFEELCVTAQAIDRICRRAVQADGYIQLWETTCLTLWKEFRMDWFETGSVQAYQQYQVQKLSCSNAKKVSRMISILEEARHCTDVLRLWELFYGISSEEDKKYRRVIRRGMREEFFADARAVKINGKNLDRTLVFFYDPDKNQFDLVKWMNQWAKLGRLEMLSEVFSEYGKETELLTDQARKKCVLQYLEEAFKSKKQTAYNQLPQECKQAMQLFYQSLKGTAEHTDAGYLLIHSLYREVLSFFVLLTLAVCGICLHRYGSGDIMLSMIFVAFAAVGLVFSVMIQTMTAGRSRAVEMGLGSVAAKCLYAFVPIACVTAAALVYQLGGFQEKAVCMMVFLTLTAVMAFIRAVMKKEL